MSLVCALQYPRCVIVMALFKLNTSALPYELMKMLSAEQQFEKVTFTPGNQ